MTQDNGTSPKQPPNQSSIHGIFRPEPVRQGEAIECFIISQQNIKPNHPLSFQVWRMSPFGIELVIDPMLHQISLGSEVELKISVGSRESELKGIIVAIDQESKNMTQKIPLVGIRFSFEENKSSSLEEKRKTKRWACSQEFMPVGMAPTPGRFNDFIHFRVIDLSSTGMRVLTSLRNKFILPEMILDCSVSLPCIGHTNIQFKVRNEQIINENGKEVFSLGGQFQHPSEQTKQLIGEYIFQFGPPTSIRELKNEGLRATGSTGIDFTYVRTSQEYQEVLELRKLAYASANKINEKSQIGDIFDTRSRILIGKYRGKIIASARITFCSTDDMIEHEKYFNYPSYFPRKDEICEVMRVCTHPDYRGSDLLSGLLRHLGITVVQSGRRYILGCATKELLPLYTKIGFQKTSISYKHPELNNILHYVFIGDVCRGLSGANVNPIVWNIVWKDVVQFLTKEQIKNSDAFTNSRIAIYKLFGPLSQYLIAKRKKPRLKSKKGIE